MIRAKLVSTEGLYLKAVIEVSGERFHVMDEFSESASTSPKIGSEFDLDMVAGLLEDEEWESIFSGNPNAQVGLEQISGWRYRAYGRVKSKIASGGGQMGS